MLNFIAIDLQLYQIFKIARVSFFFGGGRYSYNGILIETYTCLTQVCYKGAARDSESAFTHWFCRSIFCLSVCLPVAKMRTQKRDFLKN